MTTKTGDGVTANAVNLSTLQRRGIMCLTIAFRLLALAYSGKGFRYLALGPSDTPGDFRFRWIDL
jgi:hypothetical protein